MELGFVGAVAFLVFLTVGQADAVVVVEIVAEFGEVAVLFQTTAEVDIAVAIFVVAVVEEVACKQGIETVLIAVNRCAAGWAFIAAQACAQFKTERFTIGQQVFCVNRCYADGTADRTQTRACRACAFFDVDAFHQSRIKLEAALVVEDFCGLAGVVDF